MPQSLLIYNIEAIRILLKMFGGVAMNDTIITGIFTIIGVILGGCMSFFTTIHTERKTHANNVLKVKEQIILEKLKNVNHLIAKLPHSNEDLPAFREYLFNSYYKAPVEEDLTLDMLYLSDEMRSMFMYIGIVAENDIKIDCEYEVQQQKIISCRNILVKMIQDEFYIMSPFLRSNFNINKTDTYF